MHSGYEMLKTLDEHLEIEKEKGRDLRMSNLSDPIEESPLGFINIQSKIRRKIKNYQTTNLENKKGLFKSLNSGNDWQKNYRETFWLGEFSIQRMKEGLWNPKIRYLLVKNNLQFAIKYDMVQNFRFFFAQKIVIFTFLLIVII